MSSLLLRAWLHRGWLARLLWPLSLVYRVMVALRQTLYRWRWLQSTRFAVPVVVVGNVVVGGGGKTPLTIALARHLQARSISVGVISRGYGRSGTACIEVHPNSPASAAGDEPLLVKAATGAPVFVASSRAEAAAALLSAYPATQVVICDDGLQHYALQRDIEIGVFDDRGIGNGWLLPAGPLREPWPGSGKGVDLVLHTGHAAAFEGFTSTRKLASHGRTRDGRTVPLDTLRAQRVAAMAGIANPRAFFTMLENAGLTLAKALPFPDHDDFRTLDPGLFGTEPVLCTEKDAVKLFAMKELSGIDFVAVGLVFEPEPAFLAAFDDLLNPLLLT
jgi:tetraacyldisaccharide 4'-kinase